ncbi:hypothetical protein JVT61DRAFT_7908 [Boletus reticuloceps]|uniref:C2H2-type domain-containing protein n=1 Tax=Boletus reticuloceps TaxID=495285 RepID=A0A8I2YH25_9AGAM|nr:hypothetical protein JVT61DRAFT_7908 [Boletus reticuloceps]
MYRCPRCLKTFMTEGGVAHHRAQPHTACNADTWSTEVVSLPVAIPDEQANGEPDEESVSYCSLSPPHPSADSDHANWAIELADEDLQPHPQINDVRISVSPIPHDREDSIGRIVVQFLGAAAIIDIGETFLTLFELDPYSHYWLNNLYYPFASFKDWQVANFLPKSRLSMQLIDEFLSLQMIG